ncbi:MAG: hypothetical protein RBR67_17395 [Desulfobacterium sp.]|jgi:hypothetical protein|nr:hypothetical protein [Desulfobacterium sp.]
MNLNRFFPQETLSYDDFIFYRCTDYWEPFEAACLLNGLLPEAVAQKIHLELDSESKRKALPFKVERTMILIDRACRSNKINHDSNSGGYRLNCEQYQNDFAYFINQSENFNDCDRYITFRPENIAGWAMENGLSIPPNFEVEKKKTTGKAQHGYGEEEIVTYHFKEFKIPEKQIINGNKLIDDQSDCLTIPERQELGRLRKDKEEWSELLKAALFIGHWVDTCESKITKPQIQRILNNHFSNIDKKKIVISLWKALPDKARNTGGNFKEPMPDCIWPDVNTEIKK